MNDCRLNFKGKLVNRFILFLDVLREFCQKFSVEFCQQRQYSNAQAMLRHSLVLLNMQSFRFIPSLWLKTWSSLLRRGFQYLVIFSNYKNVACLKRLRTTALDCQILFNLLQFFGKKFKLFKFFDYTQKKIFLLYCTHHPPPSQEYSDYIPRDVARRGGPLSKNQKLIQQKFHNNFFRKF